MELGGLNPTHADLFALLMPRLRDVINEMMSSEPDADYLCDYDDYLWSIFANLPEPIRIKLTTPARGGKRIKLSFGIELVDEDETAAHSGVTSEE